MTRWLLPILLMFVLTSCRLPSLLPQTPHAAGPIASASASAKTLSGRIESFPSLQAEFDTFKRGATVALIDSLTGQTLGTSLTDDKGTFILSFGEAFAPVVGRPYYLDLLKGIQVDGKGPFNQAGADALRLRNLLFYHASGGWQTLMDATPSNFVQIGNQSTALSVALALMKQAGEAIDFAAYIGTLAGGFPEEGVARISKKQFEDLAEEVRTAILKDADPLQYVVYDQNRHVFIGSLVQFSISDAYRQHAAEIDPTRRTLRIGQRLVLTGTGFDTWQNQAPIVKINGTVAPQVTPLLSDTVTVEVPAGARTGPVTITIDGKIQAGPTISIAFRDGHSAIIGDKLYVSNPAWDTVVEVALKTDPNGAYTEGDVRTVWSRSQIALLDGPRQIAAHNGKLYVACYDANRILRLDPNFPGVVDPVSYSATVTRPYGLAVDPFNEGYLFVTSYLDGPSGAVSQLDATGSLLKFYGGLANPRAVVVDFDENLFVSQHDGQIIKLARPDAQGNRAMTSILTVGAPRGLAVDASGDVFVASNTSDAIYRISRDGPVSVFATTNNPSGLMQDDAGNFYVTDDERNQIVRFSPSGALKIVAYGISAPRGLAVDPLDGETLYVSLSQSNAILKIDKHGVLKPFLTGIANPMTLNFRGDGLLIAHPETGTVSLARRDGSLETLATGLEYPGGAVRDTSGALYVARFGDGVDASRTERLPRYPWLTICRGLYSGIDILNGSTRSWHQWLHHQRVRYITRDSVGNIFMVDANVPGDWNPKPVPNDLSAANRSLVMLGVEVDKAGGNDARPLKMLYGPKLSNPAHRFLATPGHVTVDRFDNVYVSVPGENTIYRFAKNRGYAPEPIIGFQSPWGMAFSDTTPQYMYVSNQGDNKIRRVTSPEDKFTTTADENFEIAAPANTRGLAYRSLGSGNGTLYGVHYTRVGSTDYYYVHQYAATNGNLGAYQAYASGLRSGAELIFVHSSGDLYVATSNAVDRVKVAVGQDPPVVESEQDPSDGSWAITYDGPEFKVLRAHNYDYGIWTIGTINTTREVDLFGKYLYVASPDTGHGSNAAPPSSGAATGGVLRIDLETGEELYIPIRSYGLGIVDKGGGNHEVYVGAANNEIYKVDAAGKRTLVWTAAQVGARTYALDVSGSALAPVVWAVNNAGEIFRGLPETPAVREWRQYGMSAPVF